MRCLAGSRPVPDAVCIMNELNVRHWSHEVGMQSLRMRRTLNMNPDTLPGQMYDALLESKAKKRKAHKTVLHKSGRSLKSIHKELQLMFQFRNVSIKEKKKLNKQFWSTLNKAHAGSKQFQLEKYKNKVAARVCDKSNVYDNKGRGTCAMYPLSTCVNKRQVRTSVNLKLPSKSSKQHMRTCK